MGYDGFKRDRPSRLTQAISTLYPLPGNNFHQRPPHSREHKGRGEETRNPAAYRMNTQFLIQLLVNGLVVGTLYGVVAMSFVLIYKATQVVNFAQGELLLIGAW